jgi:Ca2+-binding RTX toxin-like protein
MSGRSQLVFIDPGVRDVAFIARSLQPGIEAIVLGPARPALAQIADSVAGRRDIEAIHVIAHGREAEIAFTAGALSPRNLKEHEGELATIGRALSAGGDLRLWACRAGGGEQGTAFIEELSRLSGMPVFAASGLVGGAALGGGWELDAHSGSPLSPPPPLTPEGIASYAGVLANFFATTGVDNFVGTALDSDTFIVSNTNQVQNTDTFDGGTGAGSDSLRISGAVDVSAAATNGTQGFLNIENVTLGEFATATFNGAQVGLGKISETSAISGTAGPNTIVLNVDSGGSLDLSGWTFSNWDGNDVISINGSTGDERIIGSIRNDTINGGIGNDRLNGGDGNDAVSGGAGNDRLNGGAGNDTMTGGDGNDIYFVDNDADQVSEAALGGTDAVFSSVDYELGAGLEIESLRVRGTDGLQLTGNELANYLLGGAGNDTLDGGVGNDKLNGGAGNDTMTGGDNDDTYYVDNAADQVVEAALGGNDTVFASVDFELASGLQVETLRAWGTVALSLAGNELANTLIGGDGNDTIEGGGDGDDWLYGGDGNDTVTGGIGNDRLNGGAGNDTMTGGIGNDRLTGGAGADTMTGGDGDDMYFVDNDADQVAEAALGGADTIFTSVDYELAGGLQVETLRVWGTDGLRLAGNEFANTLIGGDGNDTIEGDDGDDRLDGGAGNDTMTGGIGNDRLNGGAGNDTMTGGDGNDIYYVDNDADQVAEAALGGTDTVNTSVDYELAAGLEVETLRAQGTDGLSLTGNELANTVIGGAGNDTIEGGGDGEDRLNGGAGNDTITGGIGNDRLSGGDGDDTMTGGIGNDRLSGGDGDDTMTGGIGDDRLNGGAGNDAMTGGDGDDIYYVDNAADQVVEAAFGGADAVLTSVDYGLAGGLEIETLRVSGTDGRILAGNELANTLIGGDGNDTLNGRDGIDRFNGGAGDDVVMFDSAIDEGDNIDIVSNFNIADDSIWLDSAIFTGLAPGQLGASQFAEGTASGSGPQIVYNGTTGALFYDADGVGDATQFAVLLGAPDVDASDFTVF